MRAPPPPVLLASRSKDKIREIRQILSGRAWAELPSLDDLGIEPTAAEDDVELHETFRENALAKAEYFRRLTGMSVLADDSGIEVDALGTAPGVRSRRFASHTGLTGSALDQANNQLLLERLHAVPPARRGARYVCAAVLLPLDAAPVIALGTCRGSILEAPRGSAGFGYDPLFLLPSLGRTFAEIDAADKNRFSHRARAFRALAALID